MEFVTVPFASARSIKPDLFLVARARSADLVVSVKPFTSSTSSAISDAVLHALAQRGGPAFLSIEITGDADVQIESRIDLALDALARERRAAGRGR